MTISLVLPTEPQLLRFHFKYTRRSLLGSRSLGRQAFSRLQPAISPARSKVTLLPVSLVKKITQVVLSLIVVAAIIIVGSFVLPEVSTRLFPEKVSDVITQQTAPVNEQAAPPSQTQAHPAYQPPFDASLPEGTWIKIPKIGVDTQAQDSEDSAQALEHGAWLVPDFGRPGDTTQPVIIAAHRFGWKWWWKTDFGKKNSFYWLDQTKPGDTVEIIYDQRKWVYQIYAGEEGTEITDYNADLILYTCKFLNSPARFFRYAKLVEDK